MVYGTITDEKGQPVDSILVLLDGVKFYYETTLKEVFSDSAGHFELVAEVPKEFGSVDISIPSYPDRNPKFQKYYLGIIGKKNGKMYSSCCLADVGEKTRYDFELMSR